MTVFIIGYIIKNAIVYDMPNSSNTAEAMALTSSGSSNFSHLPGQTGAHAVSVDGFYKSHILPPKFLHLLFGATISHCCIWARDMVTNNKWIWAYGYLNIARSVCL